MERPFELLVIDHGPLLLPSKLQIGLCILRARPLRRGGDTRRVPVREFEREECRADEEGGREVPQDRGVTARHLPIESNASAREARVPAHIAIRRKRDEWAVQGARYMSLETIAPLSDDPIVKLPAVTA